GEPRGREDQLRAGGRDLAQDAPLPHAAAGGRAPRGDDPRLIRAERAGRIGRSPACWTESDEEVVRRRPNRTERASAALAAAATLRGGRAAAVSGEVGRRPLLARLRQASGRDPFGERTRELLRLDAERLPDLLGTEPLRVLLEQGHDIVDHA